MDHNHDHNNVDMGVTKSCPMIMTFHAGHCEQILWKGWVASTVTELILSAIVIFFLSLLYEALKFLREYFLRQTIRKETERVTAELKSENRQPTCRSSTTTEMRQKPYVEKIFSKPHILQTLVNFVQIILSYLIMLVFMTFNYWLCLAAVLGLGFGYFFFGWIKQNVYESDCCP